MRKSDMTNLVVEEIRARFDLDQTTSSIASSTGVSKTYIATLRTGYNMTSVNKPKVISGFKNYDVYPNGTITRRNKRVMAVTKVKNQRRVKLINNNGARVGINVEKLLESTFTQ